MIASNTLIRCRKRPELLEYMANVTDKESSNHYQTLAFLEVPSILGSIIDALPSWNEVIQRRHR